MGRRHSPETCPCPTDSTTIKDAFENEGHFYTECSNKGLCDRELGLCECFDGYTGSSCQRTVCPNQCSGHGVCRTVEEIAAGGLNYKKTDSVGSENFWSGMSFSSSVLYRLWDMDKSQGCVCDPGYSGPDCSRRECPRGDDPLTHRNRDCGGAACDNEVQVHTLVAGGAAADWFTIRFREWTSEVWRTDYFQFGNDACIATTDAMRARIIKDQLQAIPNNIFEEIDVPLTPPPSPTLSPSPLTSLRTLVTLPSSCSTTPPVSKSPTVTPALALTPPPTTPSPLAAMTEPPRSPPAPTVASVITPLVSASASVATSTTTAVPRTPSLAPCLLKSLLFT